MAKQVNPMAEIPPDYWPNNLTAEQKKEMFKRLNFAAILALRIALDRETEQKKQAQPEDSAPPTSVDSASNTV